MGLDIKLESKEVAKKELRIHRIRQKEKRRDTRRVKVCMLIVLAILCHVWDRILTVDGLINVQVKADTITEGKTPNIITMPVLKEEASNIGLIHSKRFFSPEIKIEHSITVTKDDSEDNSEKNVPKHPIYTYTRNQRQDRVHLILPYEGVLLKYKRAYFTTLLELFPSIHGYISIWSDREDSFFSFINSTAVEKYKYKILASLLLLAEGVDVPLAINESESRTVLFLKKADEGEHFRLNMNTLANICKKATESLYVHKDLFKEGAVSVVRFFIENRENPVLKKEGYTSEPKSYKEFKKGKFMNSPGFLIQTYVYHCMENEDQTVLFIKAVYDLLCEYMAQEKEAPRELWLYRVKNYLENKYVEWKEGRAENIQVSQAGYELPRAAKRVFSRYFVPLEQISVEMEYIEKNQIMINNHVDGLILRQDINILHLEPVADVVPVQKRGSNWKN
ncbi:hypothetical protein NERG_01893 [Nematocida ausubeli]|uniref:Uncharacterized protein n=1 Tax=Nematocida ausubeli (strain ATCC PRA-371 / ERTm2) TaxID=1913371 RepID=H8ZE72_NEMA1|nr:hypothetical protein NERG_01893 [Nematocida ausubeli]